MPIKNYLNKKFIKKRLLGVLLPHLFTSLLRRKHFTVNYQGLKVLLSSLLFDEDILYHHFHAYFRARDNFSKDKWERKSIDLSRGASLYIDIGGYNGIFGLLAAKTDPKIKVHIFEPDLLSAYVIYKNIILNKLDNIVLHHAAVGNSNGSFPLSVNKNGSRIEPGIGARNIMINCLTLDTLSKSFQEGDFERAVIKMDAEGFEKYCLEGMKEFISKCKSLDVLLSIHTKIINSVHNYSAEDIYKLAESMNLKLVESEQFKEGVECVETHFTKII